MKKEQPKFSDDELKVAVTYFVYHFRMYVETLEYLTTHNIPNYWDTARNAILDAHLVHARVLIQFFYQKNPRGKDVISANLTSFPTSSIFNCEEYDFLTNQARNIGGRLVWCN